MSSEQEQHDNYGTGFIKLFRSFTKWEWYDTANMVQLFIHLLLSANHKEQKWHGITVERGQFITSFNKLSQQTGLTVQQVRTCVNRLKLTGEITSKSTNKFQVITVQNYDIYQTGNKQINKQHNIQTTFKQHSNNIQSTTNNKEKNIKKEKKEKKKEKPAAQKSAVFNEVKQMFLTGFEKRSGQPYYFTAKDAGNLKGLITKIKGTLKAKQIEVNDDNIVNSARAIFNQAENRKWLKENFTIPNINSQFNQLLANNQINDIEQISQLAKDMASGND